MKYYWLAPEDQKRNTWLFRKEDDTIVVREKYRPMMCNQCGKLDERSALTMPFDSDVELNARGDFFSSEDGVICVSRTFTAAVESSGIAGVQFKAVLDAGYYAVIPTITAHVEVEKAGFEFEQPKCPVCGRYRGVYVGPFLPGMTVPSDPLTIFSTDFPNENRLGKVERLFASQAVVKLLKSAKLKGIHYSLLGEI